MSGFGEFFLQGGFAMYLVTLFGVGGLLLALVQLLVARRLNLGGSAVAMVALTLVAGGAGTCFGWTRVFAALAMADPEQKLLLAAAGFSEGLVPSSTLSAGCCCSSSRWGSA
ncbi:MAG: hypothetical protein RBU45_24690 [Myxococcota bacterium]|jgi:hypothetical protein|nr:hypothetical protein [Myxococcota bacterium]